MKRRTNGHVRRSVGVAAAACVCLAAVLAACSGHKAQQRASEPTSDLGPEASATTDDGTATPPLASATSAPAPPVESTSTPVPTPAPRTGAGGPIDFSPGQHLLPSDLAARGAGPPGRGAFTGERLIIPSIGVDAPMAVAVVGSDGSMPSPPGIADVVWYDFSMWPGLGGSPGSGGNVVLAGDAIRPGMGSGVFTYLGRAKVGDYVKMLLTDGDTLCYRIEFNKLAVSTEVDFGEVVQATADESVTLITGNDESSRGVAWGRRANCGAEPTATSTPAPPTGHYKLTIVAENYRFTVVDDAPVPRGVHTVDVTLELRDSGVKHSIAFFDPTGLPINSIDPVEGPATVGTVFGVGPPQPAGRYTFHCTVHPQMTGFITVEAG